MAKKKYTRKQLKQPDEFISLSNKVWNWVSEHASRVLAMLVVIVLVIAAASIWRYYSEKKEKSSTTLLSRAIEIRNQTVIPSSVKLPPSPDGIPRFSSQAAKLQAAEKTYSELLKKQPGSGAAQLALLLRAGVRYDQSKYGEAAKDYKAYLAAAPDDRLFKKAALEGLIYCYEARKMWSEALETVAKLPKDGDDQYESLFQEARILAEKGDKKGAAERFRRIVNKAGSRALVDRAGQRLAMIEAK